MRGSETAALSLSVRGKISWRGGTGPGKSRWMAEEVRREDQPLPSPRPPSGSFPFPPQCLYLHAGHVTGVRAVGNFQGIDCEEVGEKRNESGGKMGVERRETVLTDLP